MVLKRSDHTATVEMSVPTEPLLARVIKQYLNDWNRKFNGKAMTPAELFYALGRYLTPKERYSVEWPGGPRNLLMQLQVDARHGKLLEVGIVFEFLLDGQVRLELL